jgi:hypothetical protein
LEKHEASFFTVEVYRQFASKVVAQTHGRGEEMKPGLEK